LVPMFPMHFPRHLLPNRVSTSFLTKHSLIGGSTIRRDPLSHMAMSFPSYQLCRAILNCLVFGRNTLMQFYGNLVSLLLSTNHAFIPELFRAHVFFSFDRLTILLLLLWTPRQQISSSTCWMTASLFPLNARATLTCTMALMLFKLAITSRYHVNLLSRNVVKNILQLGCPHI
jgi:hypothetical protein